MQLSPVGSRQFLQPRCLPHLHNDHKWSLNNK